MKYLLLAKSNIRKTKGLTIGLLLLIAIACDFLGVFLLMNSDFSKNAYKIADKLNTEDVYLSVLGNTDGIDKEYVKSISNGEIKDIEINNMLVSISDLPYNSGVVTANAFVGNEELFNTKIGKFEILEEDKSIKNNYLYIPYQFKVGGGYNIGDDFKYSYLGKDYNMKIKGFINTITFGSNNVGAYQLILSNDAFAKIKIDSNNQADSILIKMQLKDGVDVDKFINKLSKKITSDYPNTQSGYNTKEGAITGRTFLGSVFSAILIIVCAIILIIVVLMLTNNITNFIRENIKTLGALKAIGYTSKDMLLSFLMQFSIIYIIGFILGTIGSIFMMKLISSIMIMQSAIPYTPNLAIGNILIVFIVIYAIVILTLLFSLRKVKKIEPIIALKEGTIEKVKKKNVLPFEKSNFGLNLTLALKTMFNNKGQNITTFIIVFFLIFMSTLSLVLYQNFSVNTKLSLMTFELCDGAVTTNNDDDLEMYNYLNNLKEIENVRLVAMNNVSVDDINLVSYIINNLDKFKNKDVVYEGVMPKGQDEVAISGLFAKKYNYKIGDNITLNLGNNSQEYKLVGLIQSMNNGGHEIAIPEEAASKLYTSGYDKMYYFEIKDSANIEDVFNKIKIDKGDITKTTIDFKKTAEGSLGVFSLISLCIVILVTTINVLIILLVLYMLIKTLINKKRKEYGILKSLGYTSKQIIIQNAISFIPSILFATLISSILSSLVMNNVIGTVVESMGVMKLTFEIPYGLVAVMGVVFIVVSLLISVLLSIKIKKIETCKLLIGE